MVRFTPKSDDSVDGSSRGARTEGRSPVAGKDTNRRPRRVSRVRGCRDAHARSHLLSYVLSTCDEVEAVEFEAHLLACPRCFGDLKCLDRAGALLRTFLGSTSGTDVRLGSAFAQLRITSAAPDDAGPRAPNDSGRRKIAGNAPPSQLTGAQLQRPRVRGRPRRPNPGRSRPPAVGAKPNLRTSIRARLASGVNERVDRLCCVGVPGRPSGASGSSSPRRGYGLRRRQGVRVTTGEVSMRILVTGGAGFIGSHVAEVSDRVRSLGRGDRRSLDGSTGVRSRAGGVSRGGNRHPEAAAFVKAWKPETLAHLAAKVSVRDSVEDPAADAQTNVLGSLAIIEACRRAGAKQVVFSSTGGAMYGAATRLPTPESEPPTPSEPVWLRETGRRGLPRLLRARVRRAHVCAPIRERLRPSPEPSR